MIIATQPAILLSEFDAEEVEVFEMGKGVFVMYGLQSGSLKYRLRQIGLGEMWKKGVIGG